jgi:hypothetical protein
MYTIFSWKLRIRAYYEIESGEIESDAVSQAPDNSSEKQIQGTQVRSYDALQAEILISFDYERITDGELHSVVNTLAADESKDIPLSTVMAYECEKLYRYLNTVEWKGRYFQVLRKWYKSQGIHIDQDFIKDTQYLLCNWELNNAEGIQEKVKKIQERLDTFWEITNIVERRLKRLRIMLLHYHSSEYQESSHRIEEIWIILPWHTSVEVFQESKKMHREAFNEL